MGKNIQVFLNLALILQKSEIEIVARQQYSSTSISNCIPDAWLTQKYRFPDLCSGKRWEILRSYRRIVCRSRLARSSGENVVLFAKLGDDIAEDLGAEFLLSSALSNQDPELEPSETCANVQNCYCVIKTKNDDMQKSRVLEQTQSVLYVTIFPNFQCPESCSSAILPQTIGQSIGCWMLLFALKFD
jgi:hypothetical protein